MPEVEGEIEEGASDRFAVHRHMSLRKVKPARAHHQHRRIVADRIIFAAVRVAMMEAAELFKKGYTPRQVREHFGLRSISTVYRYFDRATVDKLHKLGARKRKT